MVTISFPCAAETVKEQDRTALPSSSTVQAPHWAMPQPYLVPVRPISLRSAHSSGISASISRLCCSPLTLRVIMAGLREVRPRIHITEGSGGHRRSGKQGQRKFSSAFIYVGTKCANAAARRDIHEVIT